VQAFVNIGVNMGVLPTKGLTLHVHELRNAAEHDRRAGIELGLVLRDPSQVVAAARAAWPDGRLA